MDLYDDLKWREIIHTTSAGIEELLAERNVKAYIGFDPTAPSLHVGSLLQIMLLARLQRVGHTPIAIVGGGTGMIGDPSGRTAERQLLTLEEVEFNLQRIREQLSHFLDFNSEANAALVINNADWLMPPSFIDFSRDVGRHFLINEMMVKDSVKNRLAEGGMTFTEMSYALLQAYDYLVLYDRYNCRLQMGGSDQWGNITDGIDIIRRMRGGKTHGLVTPLVTRSDGTKFGKSSTGENIWLSAERTSQFKFYQFWLNSSDKDVIKYLKYFTFLSKEEIDGLDEMVKANPESRKAQEQLATELTLAVHGESGLQRALRATEILFGGEIGGTSLTEIEEIFNDVSSTEWKRDDFLGEGQLLVDLLVTTGVAPSKKQARDLISGGGMYVNNIRRDNTEQKITVSDTIEGSVLILRKGKKEYHVVRLI